jgi:hypothetical protein
MSTRSQSVGEELKEKLSFSQAAGHSFDNEPGLPDFYIPKLEKCTK